MTPSERVRGCLHAAKHAGCSDFLAMKVLTPLLLLALSTTPVFAFTRTTTPLPPVPASRLGSRRCRSRPTTVMAVDPSNMRARLREESEAPFQTVRLFLYPAVGGLAFTSTLFSVAQLAAGGVCQVDQTPVPCGVNVGVGLFFALGCGWSWFRERENRDKRLARVEKGAALAALRVRVQTSIMGSAQSTPGTARGGIVGETTDTVAVPLSSFRRDRGQARRVVLVIGMEWGGGGGGGGRVGTATLCLPPPHTALVAAGTQRPHVLPPHHVSPHLVHPPGTAAALAPTLEAALAQAQRLADADLLVVPYLIDGGGGGGAWESSQSFGVPTGDADSWRSLAGEEIAAAKAQGVSVEGDKAQGILIVLKKNGRVGQRGLTPLGEPFPWQSFVTDVNVRVARGMDVSNI